MPINFDTGTINQPDAGSVGLAMIEKIRDNLVAHPTWDLVEEFTPSGGAVRWYVFKALAAGTGLPSDYYLICGRRLSDGYLLWMQAEEYSTGGKTMQYFTPGYTYNGPTVFDSNGRYTATWTLGVAYPGGGSGNPWYCGWAPGGTSTKWTTIVYDDAFLVTFNGAANGMIYQSVYTPLTQLPITMPLALMGNAMSESVGGVMTRNPAVAGVNYCYASLHWNWSRWLGFPGSWKVNDKLQSNLRPVAEIGITVRSYNTDDENITGRILGKLRHIRGTDQSVPASVAYGDAYVLQNRLWVPWKPDQGYVFDTGVASS